MIRKCLILTLIGCFLSACGAPQRVQRGPVRPKAFVTPWEYYQKTRSAVYGPQDKSQVQEARAVHTMGEDTRKDRTNIIIIGVVVGVLVIGGTVAGILIAKN